MSAVGQTDEARFLRQFLAENTDLERIELLFPDMNGVFRGKWLPPESATKLLTGGIRLPISSYALDIWGRDVDEAGLALATGDPDGIGMPILETLKRVPWSETPAAHILMQLVDADGVPCPYDPRQILDRVKKRLTARGLTAVVAAELEFYIFKKRSDAGQPPEPPQGSLSAQPYDLDAMAELEHVLSDIRSFCAELGIPAETVTSELGPGQFEINFHHVADPLLAADHATLFKRVVWASAARHGLEASFLSKPYGGEAGSGLHVHISLIDASGANIFSDPQGPNQALLAAIAGTLTSMRELQAIFAPHLNSYRRFQPGSYAPTSPDWGLDNRSAAVRVPEFFGPGARLEHRISGADANPYLVIAAILGGMLTGLDEGLDPGPPIDEAGPSRHRLYSIWSRAIEGFAKSRIAAEIFGKDYRRVYAAVRRSEVRALSDMVTDVEYRTYLNRI